MARLTFLGAAQEVTGSCHLLESPGCGRILLDCGMHQGGDAVSRLKKDRFEFKPSRIDAVILSHAHLDHSGLLPKLVHQGFRGAIHCTPATAALLKIMLSDSAGLYVKDLERENRHRARTGRKPLAADYGLDDVRQVLKQCDTHPYGEPFMVTPCLRVTFEDAGHILGSAITQLQLTEDDQTRTLVYSGDLGNPGSPLMNDPTRLHDADVVLMESTYGDRNHRPTDDTLTQLRDILRETWRRGGTVLIPSFAVGRAQEILFHLGSLLKRGELDPWQVYLDSPMAIEVTRVYERWLHLLDDRDVRQLNTTDRDSLERFIPTLCACETTEESMAINQVSRGAIIVAGSGMCTGGRIRQHFKHRIWNPDTTVIFVGYQARGTLGRLIVDGAKRIRLFGENLVVRARIETLGGLSAHAGQDALVDWAKAFDPVPRLALVHGEPDKQAVLAQRLRTELGQDVLIPAPGETLDW